MEGQCFACITPFTPSEELDRRAMADYLQVLCVSAAACLLNRPHGAKGLAWCSISGSRAGATL